ncbi:MAG: serine hydrolase domain-containing protein [Acidimicrobiia bacterium]
MVGGRILSAAVSALLVVSGAIATSSAPAGTDPATSTFDPTVTQQLDALIDGSLALGVTGMSVFVEVPGVGRYERSAGTSDFAGTTPLPDDAKFRIGSITKTFTATVVLQLVEEGIGGLSLDDPISDFAGAWAPVALPFQSQATVEQLLHHTSGIADYAANATWQTLAQDETNAFTAAELVGYAAAQPVDATPTCAVPKASNTAPPAPWCYSNTNYILLGQIVEAVTGNPIQDEIKARILQPLGLTATSYPLTSVAMPPPATEGTGTIIDLATGQVLDRGAFGPVNPSGYGAAGAIISDRADLVDWVVALTDGQLLSPAAQSARLTDVVDTGVGLGAFPDLPGADTAPFFTTTQYGLGIFKAGTFYGHNGEVNGWESVALRDPSTGTTVVILQNTSVLTGMEVDGQIVDVDLVSFPTNLFANILGIVPSPSPQPPAVPAAPASALPVAEPTFTG